MNKNRNKVAAMMMVAAITVSSVAMPVEAAVSSVETVGIERGNSVDQEIQDVKLDTKNFPDAAFREILAEKFKIANDGKGVITADNIRNTTYLSITTFKTKKITDLTGIEKFVNLKDFICKNQNIHTVDLSKNKKLKELRFNDNFTSILNLSNLNLKEVDCSRNNITTLDLSNSSDLVKLWAEDNKISSINLNNCINLENLILVNNLIEKIDLTKNEKLKTVHVDNNKNLSELNIDKNIMLHHLGISNTSIKEINLLNNKNLIQLHSGNNEIKEYNLSNNTLLESLILIDSNVTKLDLNNNQKLQEIFITDCRHLKEINTKECKDLVKINIDNVSLKYLDFSKAENLKNCNLYGLDLGYLNINKNAPLNSISQIDRYQRIYDVKVSKENTIDLNELFPGINTDKVTINTENITKKGNIIKLEKNRPREIDYVYNTGGKNNTLLLPVKLILDYESAEEGIILNDTNFPDYRFRRLIGNMMDVQEGGKISNTKLAKIENIEVYNEGITTLKGIEFFTGLKSLECGENNLTELDLSENINLKEIYCEDNSISDLKLPKSNNLMYLDCSNNELDNLNLAKYDKLIDLNCSSNPINKLELTNNTLLERIDIRKTNINSLNLKNQNVLENLYIEGSAISNKNNIELNPNTNVNIDVDLSNSGGGTTTPDQKPDQKPDEKPNKPNKPGNITSKIVGKNRYETAAKIADELVKNNVSYNSVILVNSDKSMADGLSAASLSGKKNAPILLVKKDSIPAEAMAKIEKAKNVYIIGGEGAISKKVENQLKGKNITRISGKDRYETSAKIANMLGGYKMAFIVNGAKGEADAMSVSSVAAKYGAPILLTNGKTSTHPVKAGVSYFVIGGRGVVSNQLADKYNADRIAGVDRYSTNRKVIDEFYYDSKKVYFAKGDTLVDALTASLLSKDNGMVLVSKNANHKKLEGKEAVQVGGMDFEISFE